MDTLLIDTIAQLAKSAVTGGNAHCYFNPRDLNQLVQISLDCPERPEGHKFSVVPYNGASTLMQRVCLLSGGADSTIAWYANKFPTGIYVDFGQPYARKELDAVRSLASGFVTVSVPRISPSASWKHIIPLRNLLLLTVAAEYVADGGTVYFGVVDGEGFNSQKGDKSLRFLLEFQSWYESVTGKQVSIQTMVDKTKAGWLKWFIEAGYDVNVIRHRTVTCFDADYGQCGKCQACLRKYLSFISVGIETVEDYKVDPMVGCHEYVKKYKRVLTEALRDHKFLHYSALRCNEDLDAIGKAERFREKVLV
jgi:7-cyano-7-deazaguanine synthase in queuosine biosynthesis